MRSDHGQLARIATNYDALIVSVLLEAQSDDSSVRLVSQVQRRRMLGLLRMLQLLRGRRLL